MRVLCCKSCSTGQRLAALTEQERKRVPKGERELSEQRWQPSTKGSVEQMLVQLWKVLLKFQNYVCMCALE